MTPDLSNNHDPANGIPGSDLAPSSAPVVFTGASVGQAKTLQPEGQPGVPVVVARDREAERSLLEMNLARLVDRYNETAPETLQDQVKRVAEGGQSAQTYTMLVGDGKDYLKAYYLMQAMPVEARRRIEWTIQGNTLAALEGAVRGDDDNPGLAPEERDAVVAMAAKVYAEIADWGANDAYDELISLGAIQQGTHEFEGKLPTHGHPLLELNAELASVHGDSLEDRERSLELSNRMADMAKTSDLALFRLTNALEKHSSAKPEIMDVTAARRGVAEAIGSKLTDDNLTDAIRALGLSVFGKGESSVGVAEVARGKGLPLLAVPVEDQRGAYLATELPHPQGSVEHRLEEVGHLYGAAGVLALDHWELQELVLQDEQFPLRYLADYGVPQRGAVVAMDSAMTAFEDKRHDFIASNGLSTKPLVLDEENQYARSMATLYEATAKGTSAAATQVFMKHLQRAADLTIQWEPSRVSKSWPVSR